MSLVARTMRCASFASVSLVPRHVHAPLRALARRHLAASPAGELRVEHTDNVGGEGVTLRVAAGGDKPKAAIVFCHGLGDTAMGWAGTLAQGIMPAIGAEHCSELTVVLPTASNIPITLNGGFEMPGWSDVLSLDKLDNNEDRDGFDRSAERIAAILEALAAEEGIDPDRTVLGGFSQGGALALHVAMRRADGPPLAGALVSVERRSGVSVAAALRSAPPRRPHPPSRPPGLLGLAAAVQGLPGRPRRGREGHPGPAVPRRRRRGRQARVRRVVARAAQGDGPGRRLDVVPGHGPRGLRGGAGRHGRVCEEVSVRGV